MAAPTFNPLPATSGNGPASLTPIWFVTPSAGEVLVVWTYTRKTNAAANITGISGGTGSWTEIVREGGTGGTLAAWWKPYTDNVFPTVTYSGLATGASGDDTLAGIVRVADADTTAFTGVINPISTNTSALNIGPISGLTPPLADSSVLVIAGKADNATSYTTLSGDTYTWASWAFVSSTTGADASAGATGGSKDGAATAVTSKTVTVSGGAAATGCGVMFSVNAVGASAATDRTGRSLVKSQAVNRVSTY